MPLIKFFFFYRVTVNLITIFCEFQNISFSSAQMATEIKSHFISQYYDESQTTQQQQNYSPQINNVNIPKVHNSLFTSCPFPNELCAYKLILLPSVPLFNDLKLCF